LFLGVAKPDATQGLVAGWITQERGAVVFTAKRRIGGDHHGTFEFGILRIKPGQTIITDAFVIGSFIDVREGLESFGDAIAKRITSNCKDPQWLLHLVFKAAWWGIQ
jgi:hypothetical protein